MVGIVLVSLLCAGEIVLRLNQARQYEGSRTLVTGKLAHVRAKLETELNSTLFLTAGLVAYVSSHEGGLTEAHANALLSALYANGRNIRNIGIAPDNRLRWIQPLQGNRKALGLYYPNQPDQWPSVRRAIEGRQTVVAGPVLLLQGGQGLIARTPVFLADGSYWGLLSLVVDWDKLKTAVGLAPVIDGMQLAIRGRDGTGAAGSVFFGDGEVFADNPVTTLLTLPGGEWLLAATPVDGWQSGDGARQRLIYILVALLISALVLSALRDAADRESLNSDLEHRVMARTRALQASNDQLTNTLETLKKAQDQLVRSEKLAALGGLVAGVAHELNTPLGNGMLAATALTRRTRALREQQAIRRSEWIAALDDLEQASGIIQHSLERASELVTSFRRVAADRSTEHRRRFRLNTSIHDLAVTLRPTLAQAGLTLRSSVPPNIELDGYPGLVDQMLMNLVQNAVAHAYPDGRSGIIHIDAHSEGNDLILEVSDDGIGIPPDNLSRIFDPFFTTRLGRGGAGLGLNIIYNIVTGPLGGEISVLSSCGQGTRFTISMPLVAPAESVGINV
ncbi:ATP-binding protein [Uliginosibacterium sp. sgz301328]|uniref:ATP-binding protein n=1 Tax=Uliginosibacterium sp. sgz301328 TaxID=3243764 RepID=UPI00359E297A